jgi:NADH:ubiquinone reductase (H+-translocating)
MKHVVVVGAGFAGLWAGIAAKRQLLDMRCASEAAVTIINRESYHNIRVRNYEKDLSEVCIPLSDVLGPVGVRNLQAEVCDIDVGTREVRVGEAPQRQFTVAYDRLILAAGSQLMRPQIRGSGKFGHDVDTYTAAKRLAEHLRMLPRMSDGGRSTVVVVGAGLTGLEVATEMTERLEELFPNGGKVILVDRHPYLGSNLGPHARPVLEQATTALNIECRLGTGVAEIKNNCVILESGEIIATCTVVWCGGVRASPLTVKICGERDAAGRLLVDEYMRVRGVADVFAAGDVASATVDSSHQSVMSCQHGRPMGRYAGTNAAAELFGQPMLPLVLDWYVTIVDLGRWGALYTKGFDRQVFATGLEAKKTKQTINRERIYPPRSGKAEEILAAAAPLMQTPPALR